jgi:hypothetical protein
MNKKNILSGFFAIVFVVIAGLSPLLKPHFSKT